MSKQTHRQLTSFGYMKAILLFIAFLLVLTGCKQDAKPWLGTWQTKDAFSAATYQLQQQNDQLEAVVLRYNDGTQRYRQTSYRVRYLSRDIQWQPEAEVDGTTGATETRKPTAAVTVHPLHPDTLLVTYTGSHSRQEKWSRITTP